MAVNIPGLVSVIIFYIIILATGIWAARKSKAAEKRCLGNKSEIAMVGGRNLSFFVGVCTSIGTYVGGGYINGLAEIVYLPSGGLAWAHGPIAYFLSLIIGGLVFVKPMRSKNYVTVMDPFQKTYGDKVGSILYIPALIGDIFWCSAILSALGATMTVILELPSHISIIISACVAIIYTLLGGLYSVAYTDVIQLIFMIVGLWICVPFAILNKASKNIAYTAVNEVYQSPWLGTIEQEYIAKWLDDLLYLTLGGIPWQVYFQRVLAASSVGQAKVISYYAGVGCFIMAFPSFLIGAVAVSTDWNQTTYGLPTPLEKNEADMIMPIVLQYLCPVYVSVIGIGAIAAAVMSSADSSLLSSSSMFARNIYKNILRQKASEREVIWIMRAAVILFGTISTGLAFLSNSIYGLWFLSGELIYALVLPQLICVLFIPETNAYGSVAGFVTGIVMRLLAGEPVLHIPPVFKYPGYVFKNGMHVQRFPIKTFTMIFSLVTVVTVSYFMKLLFYYGFLPKHWDTYNVIKTNKLSIQQEEQVSFQVVQHDREHYNQSSSNSIFKEQLELETVEFEQSYSGDVPLSVYLQNQNERLIRCLTVDDCQVPLNRNK